MNVIQMFFQLSAGIVSMYTLLCFLRIILSWLPSLNYSGFGRFLSAACDPYLNLFRRLPLHIGGLDFSPVLSIGLLTVLSSILGNIARTGRVHFGEILAYLVAMIWSAFSSVAGILLLLLIIRFFVFLFSRRSNYYNSIWTQIDNTFGPIVFRISSFLTNGRPPTYRNALLVSIITILVLLVCARILISIITTLLIRIPF
ncbi:MAG: YggT family protein [Treponemataceae bacterium]|nr:YggT family protein [Treponemataceae bacterium]